MYTQQCLFDSLLFPLHWWSKHFQIATEQQHLPSGQHRQFKDALAPFNHVVLDTRVGDVGTGQGTTGNGLGDGSRERRRRRGEG